MESSLFLPSLFATVIDMTFILGKYSHMSSIAYGRPTVLGYPMAWNHRKALKQAGNVHWVILGTSQSVPLTYCVSHLISQPNRPSLPWEGRDDMGTSQPVPLPMPVFPLSIPSQCTMGRKGRSGNIPTCTTPHACIPTVHPIPMYHGKEGMKWKRPNLYHPPCLFIWMYKMVMLKQYM